MNDPSPCGFEQGKTSLNKQFNATKEGEGGVRFQENKCISHTEHDLKKGSFILGFCRDDGVTRKVIFSTFYIALKL